MLFFVDVFIITLMGAGDNMVERGDFKSGGVSNELNCSPCLDHLRVYSVVALGFERLVWDELAAA